jgi:RNA polymerase sigma-70 factor, ECF subfamily
VVNDADNDLIKQFLAGREQAFEDLVYRYERKVYSLCYQYVGNQEDALDLAQETFLRVYRFLPRFRFDAAFSTWIYRLAVNTCLDFLRKEKHHRSLSLDAPVKLAEGEAVDREVAGEEPTPAEELERKELRREIHKALEKLPEEQRLPIILKEFQELSYEEIAALLQVPLGTVRSRISRGRIKLKTILQEMELLPAGLHLRRQGEVKL